MKTTCSMRTYVADVTATKALTILQLLLQDYHPRNFSVRLWDGSQWPASTLMRCSWHLPLLDTFLRIGGQPVHLHGKLHSIERDRQAVSYHYDVSNDFYSLWLDQRMVYSCAYFETADEDLDTAQAHKLDYICRKLRLRPRERLLDIGCGWGGWQSTLPSDME